MDSMTTRHDRKMDTTLGLCRDENSVPSVVPSRKNLSWQDLGLANDLEPASELCVPNEIAFDPRLEEDS